MLWVTPRERMTLALLGAIALSGLGVQLWQQQRPPIRVEPGPTPPYAQWEALVQQARQININQATAEELERLPEIGPSTSQRIVDYRNTHGSFRSPEELLDVPGIGPKTLDTLREYVTVD
jgi:competence protein ComEA